MLSWLPILSCFDKRGTLWCLVHKQAVIVGAFILNIDNVYFANMVSQIYTSELQINKANTSDTLDLHLSFSNDIFNQKLW